MPRELSDLVFVSALEAARAIERGEVSSLELTKHILERIEKYNPPINAVITILKDDALNRARAADEALGKGELWGPLHGVPCTVKDTIEIANVLTTAGSPELATHMPKRHAVVVERLLGAGAVIIGHTNAPLMGGDWQSYNKVFGTTNNPWNHKLTPGGSTGGGAAALAAGLSYLSLGSDIGGSIRIPAHFCGVYGHKPSLNVVPMRGHIPPPPEVLIPPADLAVTGPLARSAADLKLPPSRGTRLSDYRIGYVLDDTLCPVNSDVKEVLTQAVKALRKTGVKLEEGWPSGVNPSEQYEIYRFLLISTDANKLRTKNLKKFREIAARKDGSEEARIAWAWTAPHKYFQAVSSARIMAKAIWQDYFRTHDVFLLPTAFTSAFPHDYSKPFEKRRLITEEGPRSYYDLSFWISFATLSGLPATTAPIGLTKDGLPVSIQIVGPYLEDATPIDFAGQIADVIGEFQPPKSYI